MALPDTIRRIPVADQYIDSDGNPMRGSVTFSFGRWLRIPSEDVVIVPKPITVKFNSATNGAFSVPLIVSDAEIFDGSFLWHADVVVDGIGTQPFDFEVPSSTPEGGIIQLADVGPAGPVTDASAYVTRTQLLAILDGYTAPEPVPDDGSAGVAGESAYQIAVRLGKFWGTEDEFIEWLKADVESLNHNLLVGRDEPGTHPISAISGLTTELGKKVDAGTMDPVTVFPVAVHPVDANTLARKEMQDRLELTLRTLVANLVPGTPRRPTFAVTDGNVTLNWGAPLETGGTLTGYVVRQEGANPVTQTVTGTTASFTGAVPGESHTYSIRARNSVGDGPALVVSFTVPA